MIPINKTAATAICLEGRGGKEKEILKTLPPGTISVGKPLHDYEWYAVRIESKKQQNLQWFDVGKYHNLSPEEKKILMLFYVFKKGCGLLHIYCISLGQMLEHLCTDAAYQTDGWTWENIETCYQQKKKFPKMQAKVPLKVKGFAEKYNLEDLLC
jgi:hypothetical protein|tara:strand:+ start:60 stop:524 length:465 start_codon:yes stop_codon:yes gene_type:complete